MKSRDLAAGEIAGAIMSAATDSPASAQRVELHLAAAQSRDAFDIWRFALKDMFDVALGADKPAAAFRGDVTGFHLGDCLTFNNASVGQRLVRSSALARKSALDLVMIQHQTTGHLKGDYDGRAADLRAGDIGFVDFARPAASEENNFSRVTLIVPRERLPAAFRDRDLHGVVLDHRAASTQILGRYMRTLWRTAQNLQPQRTAAAVQAAFALANNVWAARAFDRDLEEAAAPTLRGVAADYIDDHLTERGLSPAAVAAAVGVSRSSLYRLFVADNGVHAYILGRRLDRCFAALLDARMRRTAIGDIAFAHGFGSEAHFSRAFQQRFRIKPRDLRAMAGARAPVGTGPSDPAVVATMRDWMFTLGLGTGVSGTRT